MKKKILCAVGTLAVTTITAIVAYSKGRDKGYHDGLKSAEEDELFYDDNEEDEEEEEQYPSNFCYISGYDEKDVFKLLRYLTTLQCVSVEKIMKFMNVDKNEATYILEILINCEYVRRVSETLYLVRIKEKDLEDFAIASEVEE